MPVSIRKYRTDDFEDVRHICIATSEMKTDTDKERDFILTLFCDYYIEVEPQNCFVAVNEDDKVIGYILCSEDYEKFAPKLKSDYIIKFKTDIFKKISSKAGLFFYIVYKKKYPAHLHIDILEEYQRMGIGHLLMNSLLEHLKNNNINGIMLTVSSKNKKGMSFYKKYGFKQEINIFGGAVMGLNL